MSAKRVTRQYRDINGAYDGDPVEDQGIIYGASMQAPNYLEEAMQNVENPDIAWQSLAGGTLPFVGYSQNPGDNAYFPSVNQPHTQEINNRVLGG